MYEVIVDKQVDKALTEQAIYIVNHNDVAIARKFEDAFTRAARSLKIEDTAYRGVPFTVFSGHKQYRRILFWPHFWLVYLIDKEKRKVFIDFLLDDRTRYGLVIF